MLDTITNTIIVINIILAIIIVIIGGNKMFGRKNIKETAEYKAQEAEVKKAIADTEEATISRNPFIKKTIETPMPQPPTTEEIIAGETDLWYKAQVLEALAEIIQRLRSYDEPTKKP